jgi:hypothetical protein
MKSIVPEEPRKKKVLTAPPTPVDEGEAERRAMVAKHGMDYDEFLQILQILARHNRT